MTKNELVWRLKDRPGVDEIIKLIDAKIITADEAKQIAFNTVNETDKIAKLQDEVELLKRALEDSQKRGVVINRDWVTTQTPSFHVSTVDPLKVFNYLI